MFPEREHEHETKYQRRYIHEHNTNGIYDILYICTYANTYTIYIYIYMYMYSGKSSSII